MLLAPFLLILGVWLKSNIEQKSHQTNPKSETHIPWFVFCFIAVVGLNSLMTFSPAVINSFNQMDTFLLTMAMTALGMETRIEKLKGIGFTPLYLNVILFLWLLLGGFVITKIAVHMQ